MLENIIDIVCS